MHWNVAPDALPGSATLYVFRTAGLTTENKCTCKVIKNVLSCSVALYLDIINRTGEPSGNVDFHSEADKLPLPPVSEV